MPFPMTHPSGIIRYYKYDKYTSRNHFGIKTGLDRIARQYTPKYVKEAIKILR
jgi:hypothetical protein